MAELTYDNFMAVCEQFKLGSLDTESSNPITEKLSMLCHDNLADGLRAIQEVDIRALTTLVEKADLLVPLAQSIDAVLKSGHKVVMEGCGATGRLSLSLESFCRSELLEPEFRNQAAGFMAGGDVALIASIEKFEDCEPYGHRQLRDLNFVDGDLLIAITEGGETPFVIAACEEAARVSKVDPYFVYCNPDAALIPVAERSARVIANDRIRKINLSVGPMAITGSTRMQATTVQQSAVGYALQHHAAPEKIKPSLEALLAATKAMDLGHMAPATKAEAELYRAKAYFLYRTGSFPMTVMTDTTERSPTFSLPSYENFEKPEQPASQCYLHLPGAKSVDDGWLKLFHRPPRGLDWSEDASIVNRAGTHVLKGYDFSDDVVAKREAKLGTAMKVVQVEATDGDFVFNVDSGACTVVLKGIMSGDLLQRNMIAKMILNAHSTCVMGVLGRFEGNVMTYVRPSNNKLIDRAARYVTMILTRRGLTPPDYKTVVRTIFDLAPGLTADEPIVLKVVNKLTEGLAK